MYALGFSRNLGDPVISAWNRRAQGSARWYPRAKATKPEETGGRESERFRSTDELGEPAPWDPKEEREAPYHGTFGGKDGGSAESRNRLNETAKDSGTGQEGLRNGFAWPSAKLSWAKGA